MNCQDYKLWKAHTTIFDYLSLFSSQRSCGWRIFECLTPNGEINPGQNASIQWVFSPLEARTYSVSDVYLQYQDV